MALVLIACGWHRVGARGARYWIDKGSHLMAELEEEQPSGSPWRTLAGLGLVVALVVGVLFVMQQLRHAAAVQDCVASGRRDCVPVDAGRG